jgi:hypothetical protein
MTPQPNAPASQPSWFSQNWKLLAGLGCLLAVMCCGLVGVVGWLTASNLPPVPELDGPPAQQADDAARVDCGTPGPDGVDCVVQRTGGANALLACWTLEITCANQGVMVGESCGKVEAGEQRASVNMPVAGFSNQEGCDAPKGGAVKGLTVKTIE